MYTAEQIEKVCIYGLHDPITGELRYIGKAKDPSKRMKSHIRDSVLRNTPVYLWFRELALAGETPTLNVMEWCDVSEWQNVERRLISTNRNANLLNVAIGGDEPYCPKNVRAENGRRNAKARESTPLKRRVWELKRNVGQALKQGYVTESAKEKLRYAARKRPDLFGEWATI